METSIIIPVYNAARIIEGSAGQIIATMGLLGEEYEILFCDDGSVDASREALTRLGSRHPQVRIFYNTLNKGLGFTLNKLLKEAKGKHIVYCDCDLPFGAGAIPPLLDKLRDNDIAVASRYLGVPNGVRWARKVCSRLYYFLCKGLFDIPVMDIGSGTVAMRRSAVKGMDFKARGFDVHAEFYLKMVKKGARIMEVPMMSEEAGQGSFRIWRHGPRTLWETSQLYFQLKGREYR